MSETKDRILSVATRLFAVKGIDGVSVREICRAAVVNVALVNYHFRNKEGLYRECLARVFSVAQGDRMAKLAASVTDAASWREAVRKWVVGFAAAMHGTKDGSDFVAGLFRHEVTHPSALKDVIRSQYAGPVRDCLVTLLRMALDDERDVMHWTVSIWSQLSAYALVDPIWQPMFRPKGVTPAAWGAEFAEFVCGRIFRELKYHGK